jgi:hypothetical protein
MPIPTYTPLATVTLSSTTSSVTFSNIPATYRDLIFTYDGTVSGGAFARIRFNSDGGFNYSNVQMYGSGTTATSSLPGNGDNIEFAEFQATHNSAIVQIMDYSATDKHKTVLGRSNNASSNVQGKAGRWANTAAITSVQILATNMLSGTTLSLYGIVA